MKLPFLLVAVSALCLASCNEKPKAYDAVEVPAMTVEERKAKLAALEAEIELKRKEADETSGRLAEAMGRAESAIESSKTPAEVEIARIRFDEAKAAYDKYQPVKQSIYAEANKLDEDRANLKVGAP